MTCLSTRRGARAALACLVLAAPASAMEQAPKAAPAPVPLPDVRTADMPHLIIERSHTLPFRSDTVELTLAPAGTVGSRLEYKVGVKAGDALLYSFATTGPVIAEFHGEGRPKKGVLFYREDKATTGVSGQFVSPMDGDHGWYFANTTRSRIVVTLKISGYYALAPGLIPINRP